MATMVVEDGTGLATANSYCSIVDADDHHSMRLHNTTWTSISSDTQKEMALMWASRLIDEEIDWYGVESTDNQGLRWPRTGVYDRGNDLIGEGQIPSDVIRATAEFAMFLVAEDRSLESDLMGFKHLEAESVVIKPDKRWQAGVLPKPVWNMVKSYGVKLGGKKRLVRV